MTTDQPLLYTEVETHRAAMWERVSVLRLLWAVSGEEDVPRRARWRIRALAMRHYVFRLHPQVSTYISNGGTSS